MRPSLLLTAYQALDTEMPNYILRTLTPCTSAVHTRITYFGVQHTVSSTSRIKIVRALALIWAYYWRFH